MGVGNTKMRESERVVVPQGSKYDVERLHIDIEKQKGEREIEEKVVGDNKVKTKEQSQKAANGVGQQTGNKRHKQDEQQATNKGEITARRNRSGERKNAGKDGNWTLKKWILTRSQEQRSDKGEVLTQQREENAETVAKLHVGEKMQSQHSGECAGEKGNDLQHVLSEANQVYRCKRDYNLRNRPENKPGSTSGDELREVYLVSFYCKVESSYTVTTEQNV